MLRTYAVFVRASSPGEDRRSEGRDGGLPCAAIDDTGLSWRVPTLRFNRLGKHMFLETRDRSTDRVDFFGFS